MKYTEEGTYTLTYTAEDECGNKTTQTRTVTVNPSTPQWRLYATGGAVAIVGSPRASVSIPHELTGISEQSLVRLHFYGVKWNGQPQPDIVIETNYGHGMVYLPNTTPLTWNFTTWTWTNTENDWRDNCEYSNFTMEVKES